MKENIVGKISYYDSTDKYGFFTVKELKEDVFFHIDDVFSEDDIEDVKEDNKFEFDIVKTEKGLRAKNIESLVI